MAGIRKLIFDLSERRLNVIHDGTVESIIKKLSALGLGATLQKTVAADPEMIKAAENSADSTQESRSLRLLLGINAFMFVVEMTLGWSPGPRA